MFIVYFSLKNVNFLDSISKLYFFLKRLFKKVYNMILFLSCISCLLRG